MATLTQNIAGLLELVLQTSREHFLLLDESGVIQAVSRPLAELLGAAPEDLAGKPFKKLIQDRLDSQKVDPPVEGRCELTLVSAFGEKLRATWLITALNLKPAPEEKKYLAAYLQEWFGAQEKGHDSFLEETLREHICDNLPIGVLVTNREGRIVLYNLAQEKITGISRKEALGGVLFKDYAAQAPPEVLESFRKAQKEGLDSSEHEFTYTDRSGEARRFQSRISSLISPEGQIHGVVQTLEDVSRPRILELEIQRTSGFLKRLLDTTPNPIFTADMSGRITFYNRAAEAVLGFEDIADGEIHAWDLYLAGRREAVQVMRMLEERSGIVENYETYFKDIQGNEVPVSLTVSMLYDESNKPAGTFAIVRDLGREKKLESEIRRNEHYLAIFIQNSPDAIITLDAKGLVKTWNQGAEKMFGFRSEEMVGWPLERLLPAEPSSPDICRLSKVEFSQDGKIRHYVTDLIDAEEGRLVVEATSTMLKEQDESASGQLIIFRDITERTRLEQVLQHHIADLSTINEISEALLSSKNLNDILGIILIGVTAGQGLGFNRAFLLLVNHEQDALVGELAIGPSNPEEAGIVWNELSYKHYSLRELFDNYKSKIADHNMYVNEIARKIRVPLSALDNPLVKAFQEMKSLIVCEGVVKGEFPKALAELLGTDTLAIVPIVCEHRSVGLLLADNLINRKPVDEESVHKLLVFANLASQTIERGWLYKSLEEKITALDKAYKELKESRDKLVQAERLSALGELAAQVAHEIRNPLVSIGGFARSLYRDIADNDPKKAKTGIILEEVDRLERYLKDTLTFMRRNVPVFRPSDPNALVRDTFQMMDAEIDESNLQVVFQLMENPPPVDLDPHQIRQVLLNVFRNAIEAMPGGGCLTISSNLSGEYFSINIADTGVGIESKNLEKLFTAFFTTKSTGSGLGLTISSQIIRNHGGTIGISSEKGVGTVFHITLPIKQNTASREAGHEKTASS